MISIKSRVINEPELFVSCKATYTNRFVSVDVMNHFQSYDDIVVVLVEYRLLVLEHATFPVVKAILDLIAVALLRQSHLGERMDLAKATMVYIKVTIIHNLN